MTSAIFDEVEFAKGLLPVCNALRECKEPRLHRDLTLSLYFIWAISAIYKHFGTIEDSPPWSQSPDWRRWLENLRLPENSDFDLLFSQRNQFGNGERLDIALKSLAEANNPQLTGVFNAISFNSLQIGDESRRDGLWSGLLEALANLNTEMMLNSPEGINVLDGFRYILGYFAALYGRKSGDIVPPQEVAQLLARLIKLEQGEGICDPACSSGSLLVEYKNYDRNLPQNSLYGQEGDTSAWALAKMNLFLHGCDCCNIKQGDSIRDPKFMAGPNRLKFEAQVSNLLTIPEDWGAEWAHDDPFDRFSWGVPLKNKGEYGYIQHMISCMKVETGRMAVIVPKGVLFRGGAEANIRSVLITEDLLSAVICLPEKLFFGAIIPVAVLILSVNKKESGKGKVLFVDASHDFQPGKSRNILPEEAVKKICSTYHELETIGGYSHLAGAEEIKRNEYNLNMPRYVKMESAENLVGIVKIELERKKLWEEMVSLQEEIAEMITTELQL